MATPPEVRQGVARRAAAPRERDAIGAAVSHYLASEFERVKDKGGRRLIVHLRRDEIDLDYDRDEPLRLVAEMERAIRRHGIVLTEIGLDARYQDMYIATTDNVTIELGGCRGSQLEKLIAALNAAPPLTGGADEIARAPQGAASC